LLNTNEKEVGKKIKALVVVKSDWGKGRKMGHGGGMEIEPFYENPPERYGRGGGGRGVWIKKKRHHSGG